MVGRPLSILEIDAEGNLLLRVAHDKEIICDRGEFVVIEQKRHRLVHVLGQGAIGEPESRMLPQRRIHQIASNTPVLHRCMEVITAERLHPPHPRFAACAVLDQTLKHLQPVDRVTVHAAVKQDHRIGDRLAAIRDRHDPI